MSRLVAYVRIARVDHWFKNVFAVPGALLAFFAFPDAARPLDGAGWLALALALLALCLTASSNYVINELIDAPRDRLHPSKQDRPAARGDVVPAIAIVEWLVLGAIGIGIGFGVNAGTGTSLVALFVMGVLYNVPPVRLKDQPYLDVLSESVNNPIRLLLGWYATGVNTPPPASVLLCYWMLGAFLMAIKRLAEYREIADPERAAAYRSSFRHYNDERLLVSIMFYATTFGLFGGVFIVRYHLELVLSVPFVAGFMAAYLRLGFLPNSPAQNPEQLYRQKGFALYTAAVFALVVGLLFVRISELGDLLHPTIPALSPEGAPGVSAAGR